MGLVQNLKKRFNNWVERTLAELSYHYIIQKEKQTMKKPDNSSEVTFSQNHWVTDPPNITTVTSLADTSGKTILNDTDEIVAHIRKWSIDKLEDAVTIGEKHAIYKEFEEWIELQDEDECDIISVEFENSD